jgi:signal transduction histidine kinase
LYERFDKLNANGCVGRDFMKEQWFSRARHALGHSLKLRLVVVFLLLAGVLGFVFISSVQRAFSLSWRDAARPMLMDYVDRLSGEITQDKSNPPSAEKALAITQRLPITVRIAGPQVNWQSHPGQAWADWQRNQAGSEDAWHRERWGGDKDWRSLVKRSTLDGHTIEFGLNGDAFERRPRLIAYVLAALLVITLLAYLYVRRLLRPLDDIRAGAQRFGSGDFTQTIPVRRPKSPDELGQLAGTINTMGTDIRQMLDAKRALLLAISHELRSPLTRARLNTELLPETTEVQPSREALLRDLALMRDLVNDLLESERLASPHVALQREPTQLAELVSDVVDEVVAEAAHATATSPPQRPNVTQTLAADLPVLALDRTRMRLLLRNLLDNALRHNTALDGAQLHAVVLGVQRTPEGGVQITVRDFGPGVDSAALPRLAEPFYRPDAARERSTGGVGLGLYLCRLIAQAHGGSWSVRNALPGLEVCVVLPGPAGKPV